MGFENKDDNFKIEAPLDWVPVLASEHRMIGKLDGAKQDMNREVLAEFEFMEGGSWETIQTVGRHGSTVVSTAASQLQGPGFDSRLGSLSVWSLHTLLVSAWVSSRCSGFLPQSKDVRVRLIGQAINCPLES